MKEWLRNSRWVQIIKINSKSLTAYCRSNIKSIYFYICKCVFSEFRGFNSRQVKTKTYRAEIYLNFKIQLRRVKYLFKSDMMFCATCYRKISKTYEFITFLESNSFKFPQSESVSCGDRDKNCPETHYFAAIS